MNKTIELPSDETRIRQLEAKLEEYTERYKRHQEEYPDELPQVFYSWYQMTILGYILEMGKTTEEEVEEMVGAFGHGLIPRYDLFARALGVIKDYLTTGGENVHKGTGLKPVS